MSKSLYKGIPFKEEEEVNEHFSQFAVAAKPTKKDKLTRFFFVLLYVLFTGGYIVLFTVVTKIPYIIAILPFFLWMLWYFTWKHTQREYVYIVCRGVFYVYAVNGYGNAKEIYNAGISSFDAVAPANMINASADKKLMYCSSPDLRELYRALSSGNGTTTAVYFDPSSKLLSSLRYYGGDKVTVVQVSR